MAGSSKYSSPEVLARIRSLGLRASRAVQGTLAGLNKSPLLGQSVEFVDYREYAPGDDLRRLDWRVRARTDRFYIKLFEEESNLRAHLVLDASASMRYRGEAPLSKFDYAATLVASLATLMIEQRDAVGLTLFDAAVRESLRPSSSRLQLAAIVEQLEAARPDRTTELGTVLAQLAERIPRRGVIIVVSDLLTDLSALRESLGRLAFRAHECIVFQILDRDELELPFEGMVQFKGLEAQETILAEPRYFQKAYRKVMAEFCAEAERCAREAGCDHLLIRTDHDLGGALSHYLHRRKRLAGARHGRRARLKASPTQPAPSDPPKSHP